jgi:hypothetical protein
MSSIRDIYPAVRYVDDVDKETDEQCVRCKGNCGFIGITGMWACQGFIPLTNADRIRSMTDEELADWICVNLTAGMLFGPGEKASWLEWVKSPVKKLYVPAEIQVIREKDLTDQDRKDMEQALLNVLQALKEQKEGEL